MEVNKKGAGLIYSLEENAEFFRVSAVNQLDVSSTATLEQASLDERMRLLQQSSIGVIFTRSDYNDVYAFFQDASRDYDSDLKNPYWAFTHDILKFILVKFITDHFHDGRLIQVFDAGAGTGNWSRFLSSLGFPVIMFDMNANMLRIAKGKLTNLSASNVQIVEGDLEVMHYFPSQKSNLILCMHNVIGLGRHTETILRNLYTYMEEDGLAFIMAINKYHAFNFVSRFRNKEEALRVVRDGTVKFKSDMPEMFCYTPQEFENILRGAGFEDITVLGFPITVYPSIQDTNLLRKDTSLKELRDPRIRAQLLALEKTLCLNPRLAYRGAVV